MATLSKSALLGFVIFFLTGSAGLGNVIHQKKYEAIFAETLSRVNNLLKSEQWPVLAYDPKSLKTTSSFDPTWRNTVVEVDSSSGIEVSILLDSFDVVSFQRNFPEAEYINYDAPPKPKWQTDQAVDKAKTWVKALLGRIPDNIGKPKAQYTPLLNLPKYHEGTWTISWPRVDAQGHLFTNDVINVIFSEKFGIIAYACVFTSKYNESQKIVISHDQAIKIAQPAAQKLLDSPLTADWSKGLNLLPAATTELWIVNPNHILKYNSFEEAAMAGSDITARLAWAVEYRAVNAQGMGRSIDVWVDTETGEVLGGDFHN
jgi:hypothetical protein